MRITKMKITKRQLRRLIREEKQKLLKEAQRTSPPRGTPRFASSNPQGAEDVVMEALEEYIDALSAGNSAVEIEALLTQLVGRAIDIAVRDEVIPETLSQEDRHGRGYPGA